MTFPGELAVVHNRRDRDAMVAIFKHERCDFQSGDNAILFAQKLRLAKIIIRYNRIACNIPHPDVFKQREFNQSADPAVIQHIVQHHPAPAGDSSTSMMGISFLI